MRTLIVQADWLLRKGHFTNMGMTMHHGSERLHCGGIIAFIEKLRSTIAAHMIDKVVVVWRGVVDGLDKYDRIPTLRSEKEKLWQDRVLIQQLQRSSLTSKQEHEFQILQQRNKLQKYFNEIGIRQIDEDRSECIDALALYVSGATQVGEELFILSKEHEFFQAIGDGVHVILDDGRKIDKWNFFGIYGYDHSNDLMIKCFTGMPSGVVKGLKGLTLNRLVHYFPGLKLEHYAYGDMLSYARRKRVDVKLKVYDAVIQAHDIVKRNAKLINMKDPIINSDLTEQVNYCLYSPLERGDLNVLIESYEREEYKQHIQGDISTYFDPFRRIILKEKEYKLFHEQVNI